MFLLDKLRPTTFAQLKGNEYNTAILEKLATAQDLPHLLFYGPEGCGKMTRIRVLLAAIFNEGIFKMKNEEKALQTPSGRRIEFSLHSSAHHLEISPSEAGIYDRIVIQETIKELSQYQQVINQDGSSSKVGHFKVAVIMDAGKLSRDAQHGLRRTMEKYSSNVRFILCSESAGSIVAPLRSRCLMLRVASPRVLVDELLGRTKSHTANPPPIPGGNLRAALLKAEFDGNGNADAANSGGPESWESLLEESISRCCTAGSGEKMNMGPLALRETFYKLLTHAIPVDCIFKATAAAFLRHARDPIVQRKIFEHAALYEHRSIRGSKHIYHLEAFALNVLAVI